MNRLEILTTYSLE